MPRPRLEKNQTKVHVGEPEHLRTDQDPKDQLEHDDRRGVAFGARADDDSGDRSDENDGQKRPCIDLSHIPSSLPGSTLRRPAAESDECTRALRSGARLRGARSRHIRGGPLVSGMTIRSEGMRCDRRGLPDPQFEQHRPRLRAMAYRMLGSASEADDAVQEAWLRLNRADGDAVANLGGWLTTVVGRIVLDMLRARSARREEAFGTDIPEPIAPTAPLEAAGDPKRIRSSSPTRSGWRWPVVLETLGPAERLAFVLHDMFGVSFDEIAPIVERSPAAARQLASRARRRVRGAAPGAEPDPRRQREVVSAFLAASRAGDFEALLEVLDPDVVFRIDAGGRTALARQPITGARTSPARFWREGRRSRPWPVRRSSTEGGRGRGAARTGSVRHRELHRSGRADCRDRPRPRFGRRPAPPAG